MKTYYYPPREEWAAILARPQRPRKDMRGLCAEVFDAVRQEGDDAVRRYTRRFDGLETDALRVSTSEIEAAAGAVPGELKEAIRLAARNIERFHGRQAEWMGIGGGSGSAETAAGEDGTDAAGGQSASCSPRPGVVEDGGIRCWQEWRPVEKVGLYIPGGSAPLFSTVLMLAIPARIAGCDRIILCSPPGRDGKIDPAILWTASLCSVTEVYAAGGIQAIAAMACGTETIPRVWKIFGPGNGYVTAAKQYATEFGVSIDMPAGPSEVMILADETCNPEFVAADLLSQAEHGPDSQAILITWTAGILAGTERELAAQLSMLPRRETAAAALAGSVTIVVRDAAQAVVLANLYAPEHLILACEDYHGLIPRISNAGSVFLGNYSPESAGDYASGTNHTLPTDGYARTHGGVGVDSFMKKISLQEITREGLSSLGSAVEIMAAAEGLDGHKNAVTIRLGSK